MLRLIWKNPSNCFSAFISQNIIIHDWALDDETRDTLIYLLSTLLRAILSASQGNAQVKNGDVEGKLDAVGARHFWRVSLS